MLQNKKNKVYIKHINTSNFTTSLLFITYAYVYLEYIMF